MTAVVFPQHSSGVPGNKPRSLPVTRSRARSLLDGIVFYGLLFAGVLIPLVGGFVELVLRN